jgi:hypothetical protein
MSVLDNATKLENSIAEVITTTEKKQTKALRMKNSKDKQKSERGKERLRYVDSAPRNKIQIPLRGARWQDFIDESEM